VAFRSCFWFALGWNSPAPPQVAGRPIRQTGYRLNRGASKVGLPLSENIRLTGEGLRQVQVGPHKSATDGSEATSPKGRGVNENLDMQACDDKSGLSKVATYENASGQR
jgi:hypothetical protein